MYVSSFSIVTKLVLSALFICSALLFFTGKASAQTSFTSIKDTVTTSRPSASAPLSADVAVGATQITLYDNGSFFLASDSATILPDTGETIDTGLIVTSMSDQGSTLNVALANTTSNTHHNGTVMIAPVTAMHTIEFVTNQGIPTNGDIVITFPGAGDNTASPSASTFAFNGLTDSLVQTNNVSCTSITVSAPTITCNDVTAPISGGTTVTFNIGCSADGGDATCDTQVPTLINPTKSSSAGNDDSWSITVESEDAADTTLDQTTITVSTIESVLVQATVDPILTFTINAIGGSSSVTSGNPTCSSLSDLTTAASTATLVNFGSLSTTPTGDTDFSNLLAQRLEIVTNAPNGYVLTATASSALINPSSGFYLTSQTTPTVVTGGADIFGIHACGNDVTAATWEEAGTRDCNVHASGSTSPNANQCLLAYPHNGVSNTTLPIASDTSGPVDTSSVDGSGDGIISIIYAAGIDGLVPAGTYRSVITYIATPTF